MIGKNVRALLSTFSLLFFLLEISQKLPLEIEVFVLFLTNTYSVRSPSLSRESPTPNKESSLHSRDTTIWDAPHSTHNKVHTSCCVFAGGCCRTLPARLGPVRHARQTSQPSSRVPAALQRRAPGTQDTGFTFIQSHLES